MELCRQLPCGGLCEPFRGSYARAVGEEPAGSGARVVELVQVAQVIWVEVGVDLGRAHARVAEHLLYGAQVRAGLQEVRREGVTQSVGRDAGWESSHEGPVF